MYTETIKKGRATLPGSTTDLPPPILRPYLLVLFSVPFHIDAAQRRWIDPLWAKDLLEHTRYIKDLTLISTALREAPPEGFVAMDEVAGLREITCIELPRFVGTAQALRRLPNTLSVFWRAMSRASLVHTAVASWPIPEAWYFIPLLWFRRRRLYINVESAFWRLTPGQPARVASRLRAAISETLNRYCVEHADLSTFTHAGYRRSLLTHGEQRGHVVEASWIDEQNLSSQSLLQRRHQAREAVSWLPLKLVFAGRLAEAKGILFLLEVVAELVQEGVAIELDVFGTGSLEAQCTTLIESQGVASNIRMRGSLPYGPLFFDELSRYDALVVPSLSDEQPRIVFDAFAQGVPAIASLTAGHAQCIEEGQTGLMFESGSSSALKDLLRGVAARPRMLGEMSLACLDRARGLTHRRMHEVRWRLLVDAFPELTVMQK